MNVTAKFLADFTSFEKAVGTATIQLRSFETGAGNVERQLNRMGDSFSGRRILQEATLAAKAVEEIGGVSKLTDKEQARLNATVTEALAKYRALGLEAPASLRQLQAETTTQTSLFGKLQAAIGPLGTAMAGAFSVTAIVAAGRKVLDFADSLTNLSAKTGISTTGLQKLDLAFQGSGVSLDTVTGNVTRLAKAIIGGDKTAVGAFTQLGLAVSDLRRLSPEQQFIAVADAIGQVQNPTEKAYAAMSIFGKGGAELLAGLNGRLQQTTDELERMGLIVDEQTLAAADAFGDQLGLLGRQLLGIVANIVGPLLPALSALASGLGVVGGWLGQLASVYVEGVVRGFAVIGAAAAKLLSVLAEMAQRIPFVGQYMKGLADASAWLADKSRDLHQYALGSTTGLTGMGTAAAAATTPMIGLGRETELTGKAAEKAASAWQKWSTTVEEASFAGRRLALEVGNYPAAITSAGSSLGAYTLIAEHGVDALARHSAAARADADELMRLGMILPQLSVVSNQVSASVGAQASVWEGLTTRLRDLPQTILSAVEGGGDIGKSIGGSLFGSLFDAEGGLVKSLTGKLSGALGSTVGGALGSILPGLGTLLGSQAGQLIGPLIGKVWDGFKGLGSAIAGLFGGPDAKEKEGRTVAGAFRDSLASMLTDVQKLEAGTDGWKKSVIAIRDAYIAAGKSEAEALEAADRLWRAEKQGGDAAKRVVDEITAIMRGGLVPVTQSAAAAADAFGGSIVRASQTGTEAIIGLGETFGSVEAMLAAGVQIPVDVMFGAASGWSGMGGSGGTGGGGNDGYLTPEEARDAGVDWRPKSEFSWSDSAYRHTRDEDQAELSRQAEEAGLSFARGTGGKYLDFGSGSLAMLHGRERVVTEAEGDAETASLASVATELAAIRQLLRDQPRQLGVALQTALVYGGAR